jgi:signal peptidase
VTVSVLEAPTLDSPAPRRWYRRILGGVSWALLATLIATVAALGIYTRTGDGHLTPVLTGSMRPTISPGDVVLTRRVPVTSLHTGDIVVFMPPGEKLARVHRIHSLTQSSGGQIAITTKGDANNAIDPWRTISMRGNAYRVVLVIPKAGWLVNGGLRWLILGFVLVTAALITRWTWQYVRS